MGGGLSAERLREVYRLLAAPLPEEAIQRTKGRETGRGYDTDGYGYQWCVDRLNEAVGLGHWRALTREAYCEEGQTGGGRRIWEVGYDVQIQLGNYLPDGTFQVLAETPWTPGSHMAVSRGDARKGAMTNAFKKAAAFFGVGAAAYRGELDEDNRPLPRDAGRPEGSGPATREQRSAIAAALRRAGLDPSDGAVLRRLAALAGLQGLQDLTSEQADRLLRNMSTYVERLKEKEAAS